MGDNIIIVDRIWTDMGILSPGYRLWVDFQAMERRVVPDGRGPNGQRLIDIADVVELPQRQGVR